MTAIENMKMMFCWRCNAEMPMLDEEEFRQVSDEYSRCMESIMKKHHLDNAPLAEVSLTDLFKPVCERYEQLTGVAIGNANAVFHHRISQYGEPCKQCGKPFRTPRARFCAACGWSPT